MYLSKFRASRTKFRQTLMVSFLSIFVICKIWTTSFANANNVILPLYFSNLKIKTVCLLPPYLLEKTFIFSSLDPTIPNLKS